MNPNHILRTSVERSFLPRMLVKQLAGWAAEGTNVVRADSKFFYGACVLIDISGFTALSAAFCEDGKNGIDQLHVTTNGYIGQLVTSVHRWGGDVIKFAGDALICIFADQSDVSASKPDVSNQVTLPVLLSALKCAQEVREIRTDRLTVHVGVTCGELCFGILGGSENHWKSLVSGPCMSELSRCLDEAASMQVTICGSCVRLLRQAACDVERCPENTTSEDSTLRVLLITKEDIVNVTLRMLPSGHARIVDLDGESKAACAAFPNPHSTHDLDQMIRQFVPTPIRPFLDSSGVDNIAEIREVVTMFVNWDSYDAQGKHRDLIELQACFYQAQRVLQSTGAYLRQFLVDDKGCVQIACWGMPHLSYLDNAHRALFAAVQLRHELASRGMQTSVGITSGNVYCGMVGSAERMEYAAIGSEVNMAARLMSKAKGRLLVSESAYERLSDYDRCLLRPLGAMQVKGRSDPLNVYECVCSRSQMEAVARNLPGKCAIPTLCQEALTAILDAVQQPALPLRASLLRFSASTKSGKEAATPATSTTSSFGVPQRLSVLFATVSCPAPVLYINGKAGSGKSSAAEWFRALAAERDVSVERVRLAKQSSPHKSYALWREVYAQLTAAATSRSGEEGPWIQLTKTFSSMFSSLSERNSHVSISAVATALGIRITDTVAPAPRSTKTPTVRFKPTEVVNDEMLRDVLLKIFLHLLQEQLSILLLENVHLASEQCLELLVHLTPRLCHPSALVVTALGVQTTAVAVPGSSVGSSNRKKISASSFDSTSEVTTLVQAGCARSLPWYRTYRALFLRRKGVTTVTLSNYTAAEVDAMLCAAGNSTTVAADLVQLVQQVSGGSNFWVREMVHFVREHGISQLMSALGETNSPSAATSANQLVRRQPSYRSNSHSTSQHKLNRVESRNHLTRVPSFQSATSHRIVQTAHEAQLDKLVLCRFESLPTDAQRVLRAASVIGPTFKTTILHQILPANQQVNLLSSVHTLVQQRWVYRDSDFDDEELFAFVHPHSQQIIYELTPASERNQLYAQIAQCVEAMHGDDARYYPALCKYYARCDTDKALQYLVRALPTLTTVTSMFYFAEAVDLLCSAASLCRTTADMRMVMKLAEDCHYKVSTFQNNSADQEMATTCGLIATVVRLLTPCRLRASRYATISPSSATERSTSLSDQGTRAYSKLCALPPRTRLSSEEQQVQTLFLRQLDKLNTDLVEHRETLQDAIKQTPEETSRLKI